MGRQAIIYRNLHRIANPFGSKRLRAGAVEKAQTASAIWIVSRRGVAASLVLFAIVAFASPAQGAITYTNWLLECALMNPGGGTGGASTGNVTSPFNFSHSGTLGNSMASASYNFLFDSTSADLQINCAMSCQGSSPVFTSACEGSVTFTTNADLLLSLDSVFQYNLPAGDRESLYFLTAGRINTNGGGITDIFDASGGAAPVFGDPPINTLTAQGDSIFLPGGATYGLAYSFELDSYSGSPSVLSQATATVHFHLSPVPEPSVLGLLCCGVVVMGLRQIARRF